MAIKRYKASADNTIVNTYLADLSNRATGANAGQADVMEIYSIYGRQSSGSQELSRILVNFPVSQITTDRSSGKLPSSGSVKFYLRLFSAKSSKTVPRDFKLVVQPVSHSWQEGDGLDLENYSDLTNNGTGSNWMNAGNRGRPETSKVRFLTDDSDDLQSNYVLLYDSYRTAYAFYFTNDAGGSAPGVASNEVEVALTSLAASSSFSNKFKLAVLSSSANITAEKASRPAATTKTTNKIGGAVKVSTSSADPGPTMLAVSTVISGSGSGPWRNVGGDYLHAARDGSPGTDLTFTQRFSNGLADVEIDITKLVERWVAGTTSTYGVGVRLSASFEAYSKTTTSGTIKNLAGAKKSYYTKRFFARGSQFFFKRPVLEARWNSVRKDDRGDFYFSSSLGTDDDNMNTLFLYNYVRGRLRNIPSVGTGKVYLKLYSGSSDNTKPNTTPLRLHLPSSRSTQRPRTVVTGGYYKTGIYTASVCLTKSVTRTVSSLYDVWFKGTTQYFTGTILPKTLGASNHAREPVYYLNITNLQREYASTQNARFNVYVRNKFWNPTIYTKASSTPMTTTIPSASYRVTRVIDGLEAIAHYTGSNFATGMSYDVSGNYFDLDMKLLQPGYEYALRFAFYDPELVAWQEQDEIFKFKVRKNEH
jgi:hypothetical protein